MENSWSAFLRCREMDSTLNEQLEAYAAAGREIFPAYSEAVDRLVVRLKENGGGENAPRPGDPMVGLVFRVMRVYARVVHHLRVTGRENIPEGMEPGPLIVVFF